MKRFFLSLLLLLSISTKAALVLPPDISNQEKQNRFARKILLDMPALTAGGYKQENVARLVQQMHSLLFNRGLANDEEFQTWAAERPDLKTYLFSSYHTEERALNGILPEFMDEVRKYFEENFARRSTQSYDRITTNLVKHIDKLSQKITQTQSQALMAGLGSLFPQDQRREILAQKNITLRTEALKSALRGIGESELRDKFQSERFGVPREDLTVQKAIQLLDSTVQAEIEFIKAITLLETLSASAAFGEIDFSVEASQWFVSENKEALRFLADFEFQGPALESAARLRSVAKNSFALSGDVAKVSIDDHSIIVVELPPHLAVFRSCSGGDCSTGSSWAYPFSPKERNFYFYDVNNPFIEIGYVSGNIVQVKGVDTFYVRDLTGKAMKPEHVDILIQGFAQVLPEIGVTQMTLSSPGFAKAENHFQPLYRRINKLVNQMRPVGQQFPDARLRREFIDGAVGTSSYDAPSRHKFGRLYAAEVLPKDVLQVRAERVPDNYIQIARSVVPKGRALLSRLEMAIASADYNLIMGGPITQDQWAGTYLSFTNGARMNLAEYYEDVEGILAGLEIRMSTSLVRDFPQLFYAGHINAKDAFTSADAALVDLSYKMVIERFVRLKDNGIFNIPGLSRPTLFAHPNMVKAVNQFVTRMAPADRERVHSLAELGFPWETLSLNDEQAQFVIDSVHYWSAQTSLSVLKLVGDRSEKIKVPILFYNGLVQSIGLRVSYGYAYHSQSEKEEKELSVEDATIFLARSALKSSRGLTNMIYSLIHSAIHDPRPIVAYASAIAVVRSGHKISNKGQLTAIDDKLRAATRSTSLPNDLRDLARQLVAKRDGEDCSKKIVSQRKSKGT